MTHLASADCDPGFTRRAGRALPGRRRTRSRTCTRHAANSAAALRLPGARFDAARCGVALYGLSPFGADPADDGLEPVLGWRSPLAQVQLLGAGESTGYGRRFVAERATWIGIVPVGYADGFRRDLTGTEVLVDGERRQVVGTVSMDAIRRRASRASWRSGRPSRSSATGCSSRSTRGSPGRSTTSSRAGSAARRGRPGRAGRLLDA